MTKVVLFLIFLLLSLTLISGCKRENVLDTITTSTTTTTLKSVPFCPRGVTNDPYPGQCIRYVDENKDGFCDIGVI